MNRIGGVSTLLHVSVGGIICSGAKQDRSGQGRAINWLVASTSVKVYNGIVILGALYSTLRAKLGGYQCCNFL